MEIENLARTMQASIAPCLLISGFGFLLLTMTNRLSRATDRIRMLNSEVKKSPPGETKNLCEQIGIFYRRCRLLQLAIALITFSIFFVSINVLLLFSAMRFHWAYAGNAVELFFAVSLICLIGSLYFFLLDIKITLDSLKLELGKNLKI